jgi:phosphoenolpyruvate-protein kinase (PTS system EI component)
MSSLNILQIKKLIRSVTYQEAKQAALEAMGLSTGDLVEEFLSMKLKKLAPHVYSAKK